MSVSGRIAATVVIFLGNSVVSLLVAAILNLFELSPIEHKCVRWLRINYHFFRLRTTAATVIQTAFRYHRAMQKMKMRRASTGVLASLKWSYATRMSHLNEQFVEDVWNIRSRDFERLECAASISSNIECIAANLERRIGLRPGEVLRRGHDHVGAHVAQKVYKRGFGRSSWGHQAQDPLMFLSASLVRKQDEMMELLTALAHRADVPVHQLKDMVAEEHGDHTTSLKEEVYQDFEDEVQT